MSCSEGFNHREESERSRLAGLAGATLRAVIVLGCEKPGVGEQSSHDVTFEKVDLCKDCKDLQQSSQKG